MNAVTTREILEKLNIKVRTLRRWQELELIPAPTVKPHPAGQGRLATWPAWVMDRCLAIRKLTNEQKTLDEVAEILGPPKPPRRRYRFKEVMERRERELKLFRASEVIGKTLRRFARSSLERADFELLSQDGLTKALELAENGHMPVLLVTEAGSEVVPAFLVGHYLVRQRDYNPIAIIPFSELMAEGIENSGDRTAPTNQVEFHSEGKSRTVKFDYIPDFDFKFHKD